MARNEEKAMSMLNRWVTQKQNLGKDIRDSNTYVKIPADPKSVKSLYEADKFRQRIIGGIIKRVSEIQNAALHESKIKELNDQINE